MPIATRGTVQGQIPFQCRKTRSNSLSTKDTMKSTSQTKSKKSGTSKKKSAETPSAINQINRQSRIKARALTKQIMMSQNEPAVCSSSGEWQVSPRKRQLAKDSTKNQQDFEACSPRKIKKENVPLPDPITRQCLSPRKVKFENGGILKNVQNSPRKETRQSDILLLDDIMDDMVSSSARTLSELNSPVSRGNLVLPVSPCRRVKSSPHKRALTFNLQDQDEPDQSCSSRSSPCKMKKENCPSVTLSAASRRLHEENELKSPCRSSPRKMKTDSQPLSSVAASSRLQDENMPSPCSTPSSSRKKSVALGLQRQSGECYQKAKQALHTSVPDRLLCRDKEVKAISSFLQDHIGKEKPASLYISGAPGTGKTACLSSILREKKNLMKSIQTIYINCMSVKQSQQIYNKVLCEVCKGHEKVKSKEVVAKLEKEFTKKGPMVLLVMDEVDHLDSKNQEVLYTMFEWPALRKSRLVLIGIANALDLTDRILPRLQARPNCKPKLLHFAPYTRDQISTILKDRLSEATIVEPMAVQLCARKVAAVAGDIRKALDVCRRAVELVENDVRRQTVLRAVSGSPRKSQGSPRKSLASTSPRKANSGSPRKSPRKGLLTSPRKSVLSSPSKAKSPTMKKVGLIQISNVISEVYGSRITSSCSDSQTFPVQQKLIVCTTLLMVKKGKFKEVTLGKLHETYSKVCKGRGMDPVDQSECLSLCELIETRGILGMKKAKDARQTKVFLKLDEKELEFALQDKVLISSILKDGLPKKKK